MVFDTRRDIFSIEIIIILIISIFINYITTIRSFKLFEIGLNSFIGA